MGRCRKLLIVLLLSVLCGAQGAIRPSAASRNYGDRSPRHDGGPPATAQLSCSPDVNCDLVVDLFDLVRVGAEYGTRRLPGLPPPLAEDTNSDGLVDILDLVCVSANLGPVVGPAPTAAPTIWATPTTTPTIPAPAECQWAWVEWVEDGDTVRVQLDGSVEWVRYINIDAPESYEPYGHEATTLNIGLVGRQHVCLESDPAESRDRDHYDRLLRYVWVGGLLAEAELVEAGLAEVVSYRPGYQYEPWLLALQADAQRERRGMWQ